MKKELIDKALNHLLIHHKIKARREVYFGDGYDAVITFDLNGTERKYYAETKVELRPNHLDQLLNKFRVERNFIVVANHIHENVKRQLQELNIPYLEGNGNLYLRTKNTFFWLDTQKPLPRVNTQNRAFTKTGLQVVFDFLQQPDLLKKTQREIADITHVGLGQVNNVLNGLKQQGFLIPKNNNQFILNRQDELLHKWVDRYPEKTKEALLIGRFRFIDQDMETGWNNIRLTDNLTFWGGEPAAYEMTGFLHPMIFTIYTEENKTDIMKNLRLVPDPDGRVEIYRKFWHTKWTNTNMVPPVLVYADLLNTNDQRCLEAAQTIYKDYLEGQLK